MKKITSCLFAIVIFIFSVSASCNGTVQTTEGPRPAATVQAQDLVADLLKMLREAHTKAVQIHDSRVQIEDPVLHRQHRQLLIDMGDSINVSFGLLAAWKSRTADATPSDIMLPIFRIGPSFCDLAVSFGLLKQADADKVKAVLSSIPDSFKGNN